MTRGDRGAVPTYFDLRLTIPAREALVREGNNILAQPWDGLGRPRWSVELHRPPEGLVLVLIGHGNEQHRGLRCDDEPAYPGEWSADSIAWHERGDWTPCPARGCGRALVWYEAGYVPGYRICTRGHHAQLSNDGRSATMVRRRAI